MNARSRILARAVLLGAGLLSAGAGAARAEPMGLRPLCADRPGKATPACILDAGHLQIETGLFEISRQSQAGAHDDVDSYGAFELRAGLTRRAEAEVAWTSWIVERTRDATGKTRSSGVGDLTLAVRAALTDPDGAGAAVSVQPFVSAPTATHGLGAGGWRGGARLPISVPAGDWTFGASPEFDVARDAAGGGTHGAWSGAVAVGRAMGALTLGAELWGAIDDNPAGRTHQATFDLTAAVVPPRHADMQIDVGANFGLTHDTPDVDVYVGVSRRF